MMYVHSEFGIWPHCVIILYALHDLYSHDIKTRLVGATPWKTIPPLPRDIGSDTCLCSASRTLRDTSLGYLRTSCFHRCPKQNHTTKNQNELTIWKNKYSNIQHILKYEHILSWTSWTHIEQILKTNTQTLPYISSQTHTYCTCTQNTSIRPKRREQHHTHFTFLVCFTNN